MLASRVFTLSSVCNFGGGKKKVGKKEKDEYATMEVDIEALEAEVEHLRASQAQP